MSRVPERRFRPARPWRWLIWTAYVAGWSAALLTTKPAQVAAATLAPPAQPYTGKTLHVVAYAMLAVLTGWLQPPRWLGWLLLLFLSLHACGTEYGQQFVPLRGPS